MALAETANLITRLTLQDQLTPGLAKAQAGTNAFGKGANTAAAGVSVLGKAGSQLQGALGTLGSRVTQLAGLVGVVGLAGGLYSLVHFLHSSVDEARDFSREVGVLASVTRLSVPQASALAAAFHHFGIESTTAIRISEMAEKNLFKLGGTTKAAAKFHEQYGFSLRDSSGHLKDYNTLILDMAAYWNNKNIPAGQRAAAVAAIFGRNWDAIRPVLAAGKNGIAAVEAEAARLGLTLNEKDLKQMNLLRDATRGWTTALSGLKLQVGLALVPLLTQLANSATVFIAKNRTNIVAFVMGLIRVGQTIGGVISRDVIPAIQKGVAAWNSLPAPLRSILARGITGNYVLRFLTGIDPIGLAGTAVTAIGARIAGAIAGGLLARIGGFFGGFLGNLLGQKAIPQLVVGTMAGAVPVFVTNPGFGGPGGLLGGAEGAAGGAAEIGGGILGTSTLVGLLSAAAAGALVLVGGTILFKALGGFANRGPVATGGGAADPLGIGPKGQVRTGAALGSTPLPVHDARTANLIEHDAVRAAAATAAAQRQRAAGLAATAAAARVIATGNAQRLAASARQVAAVNAAARMTVGSEARVERATSAAASRLAALHSASNAIQRGISRAATITHQRVAALEGVDRATAANTGVIARHGPPKVSVGVTVNTTVSVSAIAQQLTRVTSGMYAGKLVPLS